MDAVAKANMIARVIKALEESGQYGEFQRQAPVGDKTYYRFTGADGLGHVFDYENLLETFVVLSVEAGVL